MNREQFIAALAKLRPSATFLTVMGYRNEFSEISDFNIVFHMNYRNALEKSLAVLQNFPVSSDLEKLAREELMSSFRHSIVKEDDTPIEERDDAYAHYFDDNGKAVKGIKLHKRSDTLHLYGLLVYKKILMPGNYPAESRSRFMIVKDKMRYITPVGKFRQFKMLPSQVDHISVEKLSLLPPI